MSLWGCDGSFKHLPDGIRKPRLLSVTASIIDLHEITHIRVYSALQKAMIQARALQLSGGMPSLAGCKNYAMPRSLHEGDP